MRKESVVLPFDSEEVEQQIMDTKGYMTAMKKYVRSLLTPNKVIFLLILLIGVLPRVIAFGSIPNGINQDGASAAIDALALLKYGTDHYGMSFPVHLTAWKIGQMSALLSYMMVPFIYLFGF